MHKKSRVVTIFLSYLFLTAHLCIASSLPLQPAEEGFYAGTQVKTQFGYELIENIAVGDIVIDADKNPTEVISITRRHVDKYIQLHLQNITISAGFDQQLYCPSPSSWIKAYAMPCYKKCITEFATLYALTTDSHTLVITPQDIIVHNAAALLGGAPSICYGYIAISNPIIATLGGLTLSLAAITYNAYQEHKHRYDCCLVDMPDFIVLAERFYYEQRKAELEQLKQELLRIKNDLLMIKGLCSSDSTRQLLLNYTREAANKNQSLSIDQEKKLSEVQKKRLSDRRTNELKSLEKQIYDLQFLLALHVNQVIENVEHAQRSYDRHNEEIQHAVSCWNDNCERMTIDLACKLYKYDLLREYLVAAMRHTFNELFLITEYYRACTSRCIQSSTTIIATLEYLAPIISEKKQWIEQEEKLARSNSAIIERYLERNGISVVGIRNEIQKECAVQQKQRDTQVLKKIEVQQQQHVNSGFAGGPKKDDDEDEDDEKYEKNIEKFKISEQDAKHIFRDSDGHFTQDTPQIRKIIENVVANKNNYNGLDEYGTQWYSQIGSDGQQVWAGVRNGKIRYAGINRIPWPKNNITGLLIRPTSLT